MSCKVNDVGLKNLQRALQCLPLNPGMPKDTEAAGIGAIFERIFDLPVLSI